jgi:enoyl-CoA hydratase
LSGAYLSLRFDGDVALLTLDDGRGNALSRPMLEALERALQEARGARVLVIRGREKIFCGGLDLPALAPLARAELASFFDLFNRIMAAALASPRPIVTAARGSCIAGGAILLCAGDARLMTPEGKVGINEVALGVSLPAGALEIVRTALGETACAEAVTQGRVYEGEERLRIGFATEITAAGAIDARALAIAREWARNDPAAVARVREQVRRPALERVRAHEARDIEAFMDLWYAPAAQERLRTVVERLNARKS